MESQGSDRKSGGDRNHESEQLTADEVRYQTLARLEKILRLLVDRHGARMSIGEMLAVYASMARFCKKDQLTIAEIAEATGLPKQNLSRWVRKRIGDSITLKVNDDDQRVHDVLMLERDRGWENIEKLAQLLGTDCQSDCDR